MFDKSSRINFSTCDSKVKSAMEIQQDAVTLWLERNQLIHMMQSLIS